VEQALALISGAKAPQIRNREIHKAIAIYHLLHLDWFRTDMSASRLLFVISGLWLDYRQTGQNSVLGLPELDSRQRAGFCADDCRLPDRSPP
jgi:hypothetical protein